MQDCFRLHPDVYGAELEDDEPEEGAAAPAPIEPSAATEPSSPNESSAPADPPATVEEVSTAIVESLPAAEEDLLVTKAAHDEGMGHETRKTEK